MSIELSAKVVGARQRDEIIAGDNVATAYSVELRVVGGRVVGANIKRERFGRHGSISLMGINDEEGVRLIYESLTEALSQLPEAKEATL